MINQNIIIYDILIYHNVIMNYTNVIMNKDNLNLNETFIWNVNNFTINIEESN